MEAQTRWLQPPPRSLFVAAEAKTEAETEEEEVAAAAKMMF